MELNYGQTVQVITSDSRVLPGKIAGYVGDKYYIVLTSKEVMWVKKDQIKESNRIDVNTLPKLPEEKEFKNKRHQFYKKLVIFLDTEGMSKTQRDRAAKEILVYWITSEIRKLIP